MSVVKSALLSAVERRRNAMPLVTVSEILRLALPTGTEVVAGAAGLGNAVSWARLLRSRPTSLGRIERGEIWLLSSAALQLVGGSRNVARMIRDMGEAGVVAFVTPEMLGPEVHAEADAVIMKIAASFAELILIDIIIGVSRPKNQTRCMRKDKVRRIEVERRSKGKQERAINGSADPTTDLSFCELSQP